ncbi:MAG: rhomboid family intramembrane serine protease [Lachnospiraceae bacterium]|jgi:hypothetical protein|nr:rhomboid family intramembrane serine protease [Lachnospiraceae bacterium]
MDFISKLERKFGRFAIPHLMYYIIILYVVGFVLNMVNPAIYTNYLSLNVAAILHGQVWRLITFIIYPPSSSLIFVLFALYLYYMIGMQIEMAWGAFRFNLYFFSGVLFHIIAQFIFYGFARTSLPITTTYLNLSLFFAFAAIYPNVQFLLFFVIPVKVKWLAWLDGAFFLWTIIQAFMVNDGGIGFIYKADALCSVVSILNFLLFFIFSKHTRKFRPSEIKRKAEFKHKMQEVPRPTKIYEMGAKHKCAVCGRTEISNPELEFRYCSKCKGNLEYCQDHLYTHQHVE